MSFPGPRERDYRAEEKWMLSMCEPGYTGILKNTRRCSWCARYRSKSLFPTSRWMCWECLIEIASRVLGQRN